jgi:hypothetical protein
MGGEAHVLQFVSTRAAETAFLHLFEKLGGVID